MFMPRPHTMSSLESAVSRNLSFALLCAAAPALAQRPSPVDTSAGHPLNAVVVTADRASGSIRSSVSAVTRVSGTELARVPRATLADVLRLAPGFAVVDFDGLGLDPQVMVRGFYGGGEAEYVVVLVNGKPVAHLQTGTVSWDALPPAASIEAVEIVRGGASSLYGDAAIAGVINVITRAASGAHDVRWDAGGGTFGRYHAAADAASLPWKDAAIGASFDRTAGFRDHARRSVGRVRASMALAERPDASLVLGVGSHWRAFDEPGPQLESIGAAGREASDPLFRFDHTTDRDHTASLDGSKSLQGARLTGGLTGERRVTNAIRTVALAPGFGDTKERDATATRIGGNVQLQIDEASLGKSSRLILGGEASHGRLGSKYFNVTGGTRATYATASGERGALDTDANAARSAAAVYGDYLVHPSDGVRFSIGGRLDRLSDRYDPRTPSGQATATTTHTAFSPKVGINVGFLNEPRESGNIYFSASRSFKAPTLDQLYDQRNVPVPFPPFQIQTSNPDLRPQHGTNLEAGIYQSSQGLTGGRVSSSITVFQTDMTDELDFDIQSFKYVNIGKSRHRGIEGGATLTRDQWSAFATYTLQDATSRSGDFSGKRLKAIPRHTRAAGISVRSTTGVEASLSSTNVSGIFLDDDNAVTLPDYTRFDARLSFPLGARRLFLDIRNVFDARYSSSGFLDPAGSGERYLYPAARRVIEVGVNGFGW